MDNARRTRDNRAFLEWIEEDRIHQTGGPGHFDQHRGVTEQRNSHRDLPAECAADPKLLRSHRRPCDYKECNGRWGAELTYSGPRAVDDAHSKHRRNSPLLLRRLLGAVEEQGRGKKFRPAAPYRRSDLNPKLLV
jgi:hypothetical protein